MLLKRPQFHIYFYARFYPTCMFIFPPCAAAVFVMVASLLLSFFAHFGHANDFMNSPFDRYILSAHQHERTFIFIVRTQNIFPVVSTP